MKRGDIFTVAPPGEFGKPRPAIVIQSDRFDTTGTVVVVPLTTTIRSAAILRVDVMPTPRNGLRDHSQAMVDKLTSIPRTKVGRIVGEVEDDILLAITRALAIFIGLD